MNTQVCDVEKLRTIFARGLSQGLGSRDGSVCIEAAINLACGGELADSPPCVAPEDRAYGIAINDKAWSSQQARADALLPLALAQIGTAGTDRTLWVRLLVEGTIRRIVPEALEAAARQPSDARHASELRAAAQRCREDGTIESALAARSVGAAAANKAFTERDRILMLSVQIALDAYAALTLEQK